ncbi:hypothetical protein LTR08_008974 [Meristemomyces frigidus]|nr:hypothetical protein LTR08_008974 [Meristemomyces frigidus]
MAAATSSPSGFSYAQAAKGRAAALKAQAPPSKETSGPATPAAGKLPELVSGGNWADDVEASVADKAVESQKPAQESNRSAPSKESAAERTKSEDPVQATASGVSSPDLAASSSTTTKDDDSSSAPTNGSASETTWETKSQGSEPSWIAARAARKERQSSSQDSDNTVKGDKKPKEAAAPPPPKPAVLQPAALPTVNPWTKRAEENKVAKTQAVKPTPSAPTPDSNTMKENQRPRADSRKKVTPVAGLPRTGEANAGTANDSRKTAAVQAKRNGEARSGAPPPGSRPTTSDAAPSSAVRPSVQTRSSISTNGTAPPPVKDAVSWPTPETTQDKERKDASEKEGAEKQPEESTPSMKSRKKPEWQSMVVTPNIIFETQNIRGRETRGPAAGDRGSRGGARGRGGYRGGANGVNGGERSTARPGQSQSESEDGVTAAPGDRPNRTSREAMPPPPRPNRPTSQSSRHDEAHRDQSTRGRNSSATVKGIKDEAKASQEQVASAGVPRTQSPSKIEAQAPQAKDEEQTPEPIPRRSSIGTQTEENGEQADKPARDGPPIRMVPSEARKDPRNFDNSYRDPNFTPSGRGGKRGGRGRGGSRDFTNGHPANHAYTNGDFVPAAAFGVPPSPSYAGPRGNHQYPYTQRGGWSRGNPRSMSIPIEGYGRFGNPYAQSQLPPVQTYMPGMYDSYGYPATAMPYQPYMDQQYLLDMVSTQMEYYFSLDNLLKDMFLRKHMDSQGFVYLDVIASFNRIKQLTQDKDMLKAVCIASETIEIRLGEDGKERLRRRDGWDQFLLPMNQREESARNEGAQRLQRLERPQLPAFGPPQAHRGPQSATPNGQPQRFDRRSHDGGHPMMNGAAPHFAGFPAVPETSYVDMMNGDDSRGRTAAPTRESDVAPMQANDNDNVPDDFPEDQISVLVVVVKARHPFHNAASRTFSNGSIDSRSIFSETDKSEKPSEGQQAATSNGEAVAHSESGTIKETSANDEPMTNGEPTTDSETATKSETATNGAIDSPSASRHASPSAARVDERAAATPDISLFWMKDGSALADPPRGVSGESYVQLRLKALDQRDHAATGTCPYDLDVLYQFWCHFLIRNFNSRMYSEFKYYATKDEQDRHNATGLQNLVKFYAQALLSHNPIRDRLVKDYVDLVANEPAKLDGGAFKELRSAWRNGALNLKNRKKLADLVDDSLKGRLES